MRIATNACLNELSSRRRRGLPHLDLDATRAGSPTEMAAGFEWLTPAPDEALFPDPAESCESRESVALAFLALLQHLPPRQRAVFVLKEVLGWSVREIASSLELSEGSVASALHRARETIPMPLPALTQDPTPNALRDYLHCWERHDIDKMVGLMREDIVFSMPPFSSWFAGRSSVKQFLESPVFSERWAPGFRTVPTRANGELAIAFYRGSEGAFVASSLQVVRFIEDQVATIIAFVGPEHLRGFDLPSSLALPDA